MLVRNLLENAPDSAHDQNVHKLERLSDEVSAALRAGSIYKPDYENLKHDIDRTIEKVSKKMIDEPYWYGSGGKWNDIDEALGPLYGPNYARDVLALKNKLARVKSEAGKNTEVYKAVKAFYEKYKTVAENLAQLKTMVVTASMKRDAKKKVQAEEKAKKHVSSATLVKVLEEHMQEYIDRAVEMKKESIEYLAKQLKKVDWDLDKIHVQADYRKHGRTEHQRLNNMRAPYFQIFEVESHADSYSRDPNKHTKLKRSPKKEKLVLEATREAAKKSYLEWVDKMIDKIGAPVVKAKMTGDPWHGSTLTVETDAGETQTWHTKMILNFSKYGTMFNQFPSLRKS